VQTQELARTEAPSAGGAPAAAAARLSLGAVGVRSPALRWLDAAGAREVAARLEEWGYGAVWLDDGGVPGALEAAANLLEAGERLVAVAGVEVGLQDPRAVAARATGLAQRHPARALVCVSGGRRWMPAERSGWEAREAGTTEQLRAQLAALDACEPAPPIGARLVAAFGERELELARECAAGALLPFTTPQHTRLARALLGPDPLLAVTQAAVYEADPPSARGHARRFLATQLASASNLSESLARMAAIHVEDLRGAGWTQLVDALVAWGDESVIRQRVREHFDAGADHVCVQIALPPGELGLEELGRLALPLCA
jgi:probable F420-dependent oxidoreductase